MNKDLKSYLKHDNEYREGFNSYNSPENIIERVSQQNFFSKAGFNFVLSLIKKMPDIHIDIGSGSGWLTERSAPYFKKVIGIEPSLSAIEIARIINKNRNNVEFINADMVDGLEIVKREEPLFITTSIVLSHIKDFHVKNFLNIINELPEDSVLYFYENYDKNIHWNLWHVRSKDWWRNNLTNWQLFFLDLNNDGYKSGIIGIKLKKEELLPCVKMGHIEKLLWHISRPLIAIKRLIK